MSDGWMILLAVASAVLIRFYGCMLVWVKGRSMMPTLQDGDILFVNRLLYHLRPPRRGEVVICHYPNRVSGRYIKRPTCFVKRVVALPGDQIAYEEGQLILNGEVQAEPFLSENLNRFPRKMEERLLGEGEYFVMGDNRDHSNDSRAVGPLKKEQIIGRVEKKILHLPRNRRKRKKIRRW